MLLELIDLTSVEPGRAGAFLVLRAFLVAFVLVCTNTRRGVLESQESFNRAA
jgi:hypothetical protein